MQIDCHTANKIVSGVFNRLSLDIFAEETFFLENLKMNKTILGLHT